MKRSRIALALFLGTFGACLLAAGFADGGYPSTGCVAGAFRDDLDEPADEWTAFRHGDVNWARKALIDLPVATPRYDARPAPTVIIVIVPSWSACPIIAAARTVGGSLEATGPNAPMPDTTDQHDAAEESAFDCVTGAWLDAAGVHDCTWLAADPRHSIGIDEALSLNRTEDGLSTIAHTHRAIASGEGVDPVVALIAGISGPWPALLVAQQTQPRHGHLECAWDGCSGFPDGSTGGWLESNSSAGAVQAWRALGGVARDLAERFVRTRQAAIAGATRQLVIWLSRYSQGEGSQASRGPALNTPSASSDTSRAKGLLVAL